MCIVPLVADLYVQMLNSIISTPSTTGHGRNGYYFAENGECYMYDISKEIQTVMVDMGLSSGSEPTQFTDEECQKYLRVCTTQIITVVFHLI